MVIISQLPKIIHRFCPRDANFEPIALYVSTISKKSQLLYSYGFL